MLDMLKAPSLKKYYDYWTNVRLTPPNKIFSLRSELKLTFDSDTVEVFYPGPGHTPDNIIVYYPKKNFFLAAVLLKVWQAIQKDLPEMQI